MFKKSPSGSLCPYYYKGGELHPLHYGSYGEVKEALLRVIAAEEAFICAQTSPGGRRVWIDLYETRMEKDVMARLADHICMIGHKVTKMALVGCSQSAYRAIVRKLRERDCHLASHITRFEDPEIAKDWLVGKRSE